jgi:uncharacterized membrane protein YphA (DoxX/SURF4 family)
MVPVWGFPPVDAAEIVALSCGLALAVVFLASGLSKLRRRERFAEAIAAYRFGARFAVVVSWILPPGEVLLGLAWLVPAATPIVGVVTLVLLGAFSFGLRTPLREASASCGCGGLFQSRAGGWNSIARNALLALYALAALLSSSPSRAWLGPTTVIAITAAGALLLVAVATDELFSLELQVRRVRVASSPPSGDVWEVLR